MHESYLDIWNHYFPDITGFKLKRSQETMHLTSGSYFIYIVEFLDLLDYGCINIDSGSKYTLLFVDFCKSTNCTSLFNSLRGGFLKLKSSGQAKIKNVYCNRNTVYDATFSGQSILIFNDYTTIERSSFENCFGNGSYSSVPRFHSKCDISSLNHSFNTCMNDPSSRILNHGRYSFCYISSNIATNGDVLMHTGTYILTLSKTIFINNTANSSIFMCEGGSSSYISSCSFIKNNSTVYFRSLVYNSKNSSIFVEKCSLIDNIIGYSCHVHANCTVDLNEIGTESFYIFLSLNIQSTLLKFIDIQITCMNPNIFNINMNNLLVNILY